MQQHGDDDRYLSPPQPLAAPKQKHTTDTQHPPFSKVPTNNAMTAAAVTTMMSNVTKNATTAGQHHKEVEALSIRRLQQQLAEFKFEPNNITFPSSDDSHTSDEESGDERRQDDERVAAHLGSSTQIRSKFLNKLGIEGQHTAKKNQERRDIPIQRPADASYETKLNDVVRQRQQDAEAAAAARKAGPFAFFKPSNFSSVASPVPSKLEKGKDNDNEAIMEHDNTHHQPNPKRTLQFEPIVTVHPIPIHTAYSQRVRQTVWTSAREMEEEVARNCIEFAAEDWDWKKVLEEEDMVVYHGQLVHPVHFGT